MAYHSGGASPKRSLVWFGRDGKRLDEAGQPESYLRLRISPDGKRAVVSRTDGSNIDLWLLDFSRSAAMTRLTFDPKVDDYPVWSPDGRQVAFASDRSGIIQLYRKDTGGTAREVQLTSGGNPKVPTDWSRDGKYLLYQEFDPKTGFDVWALPLEGDHGGKPIPVAQSPFNETDGFFSPDGKWIAYMSTESGRNEVYVQPFPPTGAKWMISTQGGVQPKWRGDGKELFYLPGASDRIMAVNIRTAGGGIEYDAPHELFPVSTLPAIVSAYDVSADGQRFLVLQPPAGASPDQNALTVVLNWQAGLKK